MSDDLYHQDILDHYHHPDNFGKQDHADYVIAESNSSCGDSFTFYLKINHQSSIIETIQFTGTGCAISTAACSILTSKLKGQPVSALKNLDLNYMQNLLGVEIGAARLKCLLLPAKALSKIHNH
jgi:nitrogen fixation NifU-like protein